MYVLVIKVESFWHEKKLIIRVVSPSLCHVPLNRRENLLLRTDINVI